MGYSLMGDGGNFCEERPLHSMPCVHALLESHVCSPGKLPFEETNLMSCVSVHFMQSAFVVNSTSIAPQHQCAILRIYTPLFWLTAATPAAMKRAMFNTTSMSVVNGCSIHCDGDATDIMCAHHSCLHFIQGLACT